MEMNNSIELKLPETLMDKTVKFDWNDDYVREMVNEASEMLEQFEYDTASIYSVIDEWKANNGWIANLFSKSPDYVPEKFYIYKKGTTLRRPVNKEGIKKFIKWALDACDCIASENEIMVGLFKLSDLFRIQDKYGEIIRRLDYDGYYTYKGNNYSYYRAETDRLSALTAKYLCNTSRFGGSYISKQLSKNLTYSCDVFWHLEEIAKTETPDILGETSVIYINKTLDNANLKCRAVVGQKTTKFYGKLMRELGMDKIVDLQKTEWVDEATGEVHERIKDMGYNYYRALLGDSINPYDYERDIVISINPIDYWTMSFMTDTASCHTIDKENLRNCANTYEGQYSSGTESYMLDGSSFIVYVVPSEEWQEKNKDRTLFKYDSELELPTELKSKFKRCVFAIGEDKLLQSRVYPDGRDGGDESLAAQLRNIVQKEIASLYDTPNMWVVKKGTEVCREITKSYGTHYKDYTCCSDSNVSYLKRIDGLLNENKIIIGHNPICVRCGNEHSDTENIMCSSCTGDEVCDYCGSHINIDYGDYERVEDSWGNVIYFCCPDCAENRGYVWCDNVEEWKYSQDDDVHYDEYKQYWFYDRNGEAIETENGNWYENAYNAERDGYAYADYDDIWEREEDVYFDDYLQTTYSINEHPNDIRTDDGNNYMNEANAKAAGYIEDENGDWVYNESEDVA